MSSHKDDLYLRDYRPRSMLQVPAHPVQLPRFPVFDAHNHLGSMFGGVWARRGAGEVLAALDAAGVQAIVDLDGGYGEHLRAEIARLQEPAPGRIFVFAGINYETFAEHPNFGEVEARRLRESARMGAFGLKIWKPLGLRVRDPRGRLVAVDNQRLDPLWETAAELGLPVMIHVADPVAFFQPLDACNERWEELHAHPDWHFYPTRPPGSPEEPGFPPFEELIEQLSSLLLRHPQTTFIGAHVGCYAENLAWVGRVLDACPNFYVDISERIAELGRQPYTAREFFLRYQDRILFGLDRSLDEGWYQLYYRFLETRDEYFNPAVHEIPTQGRWMIHGVALPDDVLKKIYYVNSRRIILKQG